MFTSVKHTLALLLMLVLIAIINSEILKYEAKLDGSLVPDSEVLIVRNDATVRQQSDSRQCVCNLGVCSCCTGYFLDLIDQKACIKIKYRPEEFAFDVSMSMNDNVLYENTMSGKNPKPACINPPRMPNAKICAKFSNVFFPGRNVHFCTSMLGQWGQFELFNISFDCLRIGAQGIAMMKPEDGGGIEIVNPAGGVDADIDAGEDDIEDYDENVVKSLFSLLH